MAERIVVIGAGGFGRETLDVIEAINAAGGATEMGDRRRWSTMPRADPTRATPVPEAMSTSVRCLLPTISSGGLRL